MHTRNMSTTVMPTNVVQMRRQHAPLSYVLETQAFSSASSYWHSWLWLSTLREYSKYIETHAGRGISRVAKFPWPSRKRAMYGFPGRVEQSPVNTKQRTFFRLYL